MPALNFKKKFAPLVASGQKRQTIRKERKKRIKPGDILYLYTGMRTRSVYRIMTTTCLKIDYVQLDRTLRHESAFVNNRTLVADERHDLAVADGFNTFSDLLDFFDFQYGLPFDGVIIHW
jgi:uncharacterized protein YqfB (UPF0267 family)